MVDNAFRWAAAMRAEQFFELLGNEHRPSTFAVHAGSQSLLLSAVPCGREGFIRDPKRLLLLVAQLLVVLRHEVWFRLPGIGLTAALLKCKYATHGHVGQVFRSPQ